MLLPTHYDILIEAISKIKGITINKNNIKYSNKNNYTLNLSNTDIENLIKGLFYPDLPCAYFYIENKHLLMDLRLCSVTKIATLGRATDSNITSQIEESHNGRFSINHSMADNEMAHNIDIRNNILARCLTVFYSFLEKNDYTFLGYLLHIIQDSWSPVHTKRENKTDVNIITTTINDISNVFKNIKHTTPIITGTTIDYSSINNLIYIILDDRETMMLIFEEINNMPTDTVINLRNLINIIIDKMLEKCFDFKSKKQMLLILLGYDTFFTTKESVPRYKLFKYNITNVTEDELQKNHSNILQSVIFYDDLSHSLRRIYKIIMNSLYNIDVQNKILSLKNDKKPNLKIIDDDNCYNENRLYITNYLYYPSQNHDQHFLKDCKLNLLIQNRNLFDFAVCDTTNILKMGFDFLIEYYEDNTKINDLLMGLHNYLINKTFYMSDNDLTSMVKHDDIKKQKDDIIPEKTKENMDNIQNSYSLSDSETKSLLGYCFLTNKNFAMSNFKVKAKQIIHDLNNKIKLISDEKIGGNDNNSFDTNKLLLYKKKYKYYKKLYLQENK